MRGRMAPQIAKAFLNKTLRCTAQERAKLMLDSSLYVGRWAWISVTTQICEKIVGPPQMSTFGSTQEAAACARRVAFSCDCKCKGKRHFDVSNGMGSDVNDLGKANVLWTRAFLALSSRHISVSCAPTAPPKH